MTSYRIDLLPENDRTNGWAAHLPPRTPLPRLAGEVRADWIVVGAGWAGLAAARRLAENRPSDRIAVIDAAAVSDGASGRNSGFAIDLPHTIGGSADENESALGYMRLARGAIAWLKRQIDDHGIECDWRERGKYQAAVTDRGTAVYLEPFAEALAKLGEPFEWLAGPGLAAKLGTSHFTRAVYTPGGALLNPVALVRGLADSLPENVELYEHTPGPRRRVCERNADRDPRRVRPGAADDPRRQRFRARVRGVREPGPADGRPGEPHPSPDRGPSRRPTGWRRTGG